MRLIMSDRPLALSIPNTDNTRYIDLSSMNITNCIGCFKCWVKTPGKCCLRDDATKVYPVIAQCDKLMYITRTKYGGYDSIMKRMLERAIPIQQAFIRIHQNETHHLQRNVLQKEATIIAYGEISDEEKDIFKRLVERNSKNMNFKSYRIIFTDEEMLEKIVKENIQLWGEQ